MTEHVTLYLEHYIGDPISYSGICDPAALAYDLDGVTGISQGCGYADQYHLVIL